MESSFASSAPSQFARSLESKNFPFFFCRLSSCWLNQCIQLLCRNEIFFAFVDKGTFKRSSPRSLKSQRKPLKLFTANLNLIALWCFIWTSSLTFRELPRTASLWMSRHVFCFKASANLNEFNFTLIAHIAVSFIRNRTWAYVEFTFAVRCNESFHMFRGFKIRNFCLNKTRA